MQHPVKHACRDVCLSSTILSSKLLSSTKGRVSSHRSATTSQASEDKPQLSNVRRRILLSTSVAALTSLVFPTIQQGPYQLGSARASEVLEELAPDEKKVELPSKIFVDRDFSLEIPPGFKTEVSYSLDTNPVKARFSSPDGVELVSVVTRNAAEVKLTFVQLTNISQYGDEKEVAKLVLPPGTRVESFGSETIEMPPRDTGTPAGVVEIPPQTFYRYLVASSNGAKVALTVCALKGRIFLVGGSAPASRWGEAGGRLQKAVDSFRLVV